MSVKAGFDGDLRRRGLQTLFDQTPDPVFILDTAGHLIAGNPALAERGGVPLDQLSEQAVLPAVHPADRERVEGEFRAAVGGEIRHYTTRVRLTDGATFRADVVNAPILNDGEVLGVLGIARDVQAADEIRISLERSEGLLRIASRMARLGGWSVEPLTGQRRWTEGMYDLMGYAGAAMPALPDLMSGVEAAVRAPLTDAIARCAADGSPVDVTGSFRRPDGTEMVAHIIGEAVRDESGAVVLIQGGLLDITEELRVRRERADLETRLAAALNGIDDSIVFVDSDWRITFLNARAIELLGRGTPERPATDLIGTELWDLQLPDPEGEAMLRESMRTRRTLVRRRFDEDLGRWMEVTGFPTGDLMGIQVRDVTETEEARRRIVDDTRRIHAQTALLDAAGDGIVMRGLSGVIEYANAATGELLGLGTIDLVGMSLSAVLGLDEASAHDADASLGRVGRWERELTVANADGEARTIESRWQLVNSPDGNPDAVFCILTDVTERRRQDELMLRTQRMESIGTLAGGIAHDLNNVLTPLLLSTQLMAEGEDDPARARIFSGMQQTINRGAAMIRQVLTFARGVEGEREVVDIGALIGRFATFCGDILPKQIVIDVASEDGLYVLGDRTQLMQVLMNLATNARDAMPDGGRLTVRARGAGPLVRIEVTDEGSGIAADVLVRMFEPFFTTKGIGNGTGLGLSVSQAIARNHGGGLEATSTIGVGSTFDLELPRAVEALAEQPSPGVPERVDLAGLRVLIVDDEDGIVDAASLVIARAGGIPFPAPDAPSGQEILGRQTIDVILTDLVMPGTTGRQFLDWLLLEHPAIPVIAMSGIPEQGSQAAQRPNVRATLDKPFSAGQLLDAIARASSAGTG